MSNSPAKPPKTATPVKSSKEDLVAESQAEDETTPAAKPAPAEDTYTPGAGHYSIPLITLLY